jgi:hypothetical protein
MQLAMQAKATWQRPMVKLAWASLTDPMMSFVP